MNHRKSSITISYIIFLCWWLTSPLLSCRSCHCYGRTLLPYLQWYFFTPAHTLLPQQDCVSIVNTFCRVRQASWKKDRLTISIKRYWSQGWAPVTVMNIILIRAEFWWFSCPLCHQVMFIKSTFSFPGSVWLMKVLCNVEQWWFCLSESFWQLTETVHSLFYLFESQQ